jgi:hypothetical protein
MQALVRPINFVPLICGPHRIKEKEDILGFEIVTVTM